MISFLQIVCLDVWRSSDNTHLKKFFHECMSVYMHVQSCESRPEGARRDPTPMGTLERRETSHYDDVPHKWRR